ncbi:MAG: hypothetical protein AAGI90_06485 [Chlamydiota bacterium]
MAHPTFNQPKKSGDYYRTLYNQSKRKLRDEPGSSASSMSSQGPSKYTYAKRRDYSTDPIVQATRHFTGQLNQSTQVLELLMKTLKKNVEEMNKKLNNMADALAQFKVIETLDKKERENPVRTVFKSLYGLDSRKSSDNANSVTESVGHIENSITELQKTLLYLGNLIAINQPDTVSLQQTTIHSSAIHEGSHPQSTGPSTAPFHVPPRPSILPCEGQPTGDHPPNNATWPLNSPSQSSSRASYTRPSNHPLPPFHAPSKPSTLSYTAQPIGDHPPNNATWPLNSLPPSSSRESYTQRPSNHPFHLPPGPSILPCKGQPTGDHPHNATWPLNSFPQSSSRASYTQEQAKPLLPTHRKKRERRGETQVVESRRKSHRMDALFKKPSLMSSIPSDQPFGHEGNPQSDCFTLGSNVFNSTEKVSTEYGAPFPQNPANKKPLSARNITQKHTPGDSNITPAGIGEDPSLDTWTKQLLQQQPLEK